MLTHICMKDHFNNQVAEFTEVSLLHVVENIAVVFLHHPNINRCSINRFSIAYSRAKYLLYISIFIFFITDKVYELTGKRQIHDDFRVPPYRCTTRLNRFQN